MCAHRRAVVLQGARSTPRPVRLVRHAGPGLGRYRHDATLGLSKMDWNNDALYDPLPSPSDTRKCYREWVKRMQAWGAPISISGFSRSSMRCAVS